MVWGEEANLVGETLPPVKRYHPHNKTIMGKEQGGIC